MNLDLNDSDRHLLRQCRDTALAARRALFFVALGAALIVALVLARRSMVSHDFVSWFTVVYVIISTFFHVSASLLLRLYKLLIQKLASALDLL